MHHFFVSPTQIEEKTITILGTDVNHIKNVLRMQPGEELNISSGEDSLEYRCRIRDISPDSVKLEIMWKQELECELPSRIYLFQGLPKSDKMEWIIQKAVELGVYEIIPVATKRAVVKLDAKKAENKRKRWQQIAEGAAKQSKRMVIPQIHQVINFSQALEYASKLDVKMIPYELAKGMGETREFFSKIPAGASIGIFIGPEGGFEETEVGQAMEVGAKPITLGKRILRTETAGMTVLSILMFLLETEDQL